MAEQVMNNLKPKQTISKRISGRVEGIAAKARMNLRVTRNSSRVARFVGRANNALNAKVMDWTDCISAQRYAPGDYSSWPKSNTRLIRAI